MKKNMLVFIIFVLVFAIQCGNAAVNPILDEGNTTVNLKVSVSSKIRSVSGTLKITSGGSELYEGNISKISEDAPATVSAPLNASIKAEIILDKDIVSTNFLWRGTAVADMVVEKITNKSVAFNASKSSSLHLSISDENDIVSWQLRSLRKVTSITVNSEVYPYTREYIKMYARKGDKLKFKAKDEGAFKFYRWEVLQAEVYSYSNETQMDITLNNDISVSANFAKKDFNDITPKPIIPVGNVYTINDIEEFKWFVDECSIRDNDFYRLEVKFGNDIDLSDFNFNGINNTGAPFKGTINGNGKKITVDIIANKEDVAVGLFYDMGDSTFVKKLTIEGNIKTVNTTNVGGLVGIAKGAITIENVETKVNIDAEGKNEAGNVVNVGGLVGNISGSTIKLNNITNRGSIKVNMLKHSTFGGVVGYVGKGIHTYKGLYNYGDLKLVAEGDNNTKSAMGGIMGAIVGGSDSSATSLSLETVYNEGKIDGLFTAYAGGIFGGFLTSNDKVEFTINKAYNKGVVSGWTVGGIVGVAADITTIINSYNTGTITSSSTFPLSSSGGILGKPNLRVVINYSYNIGSVSGKAYSSIIGENLNNLVLKDVYSLTGIADERVVGTYNVYPGVSKKTASEFNSLLSGLDPNIWTIKTVPAVNGVSKRPYIKGLE